MEKDARLHRFAAAAVAAVAYERRVRKCGLHVRNVYVNVYDTCCTCDIGRRVHYIASPCDPVSCSHARFSYGSVLFPRERKHPVAHV